MRRLLTTTVAITIVSSASVALAGFKLPKSVYRVEDLAKAQAEAREKGRPLAFILTSEETPCPLATAASLQIIKGLQDRAVLVYLNGLQPGHSRQIPREVASAVHNPQMGRLAPRFVIVDATMKNVWAAVPHVDGKKELAQVLVQTNKMIIQKTAPLKVDDSRPVRTWESRTGKKLEASLVQEIGTTTVVLKKQDGTKIKVPREKLSDADLDYIQSLKYDVPTDTKQAAK